jgi:hypothetical protein
MKREKLESYLGKEVTVTMWDGDTATGVLIKGYGNEENYYSCSLNGTGGRFWFRSSHVTKIKEAGNAQQLL